MVDEREFEPRLGRIRSGGSKRGASYLQRVLRAASLAGSVGKGKFQGNRIGRGAGAGRVLSQRDRYAAFRSRRVVIKTRVVKFRGQGLKAAGLHLRYIQRDGVTREGAPGTLYDRTGESVDGKAFLERSDGDRHQFRFIVSAEDAGQYDDLKPFVRKLMVRMEQDLGTELDWVAVDHHNTGHPHSHVVLRGRDDQGRDLVIAREYIAHGMRERAAEIVTLDLGPKTDLEIDGQFRSQVEQERLTYLDKSLRRQADQHGEISFDKSDPSVAHHHRAGRLQVLARLELAEEIAPGRWKLVPDFERVLREMGERGDIIKTMHRELSANGVARSMGDLAIFVPDDHHSQPIVGRVVARGLADEERDSHFTVIDGADGRAHYIELGQDADMAISAGAIIGVRGITAEPRPVDVTVQTVAAANQGVYTPQAHQRFDHAASPEFIQAHVRRLEAMRRLSRSVERNKDGSWSIAPDHARRGIAHDRASGKVPGSQIAVLSLTPLEKLPTANARTWLDRVLLADQPVALREQGFGLEIKKALDRRQQWLIEERFAREEAGRTVYRASMMTDLRDRDLTQAGRDLSREFAKPYVAARPGEKFDGTYRGPVQLTSGRFAVIDKAREFTLVPWRPVLERHLGKPVAGIMRGDAISWTIGRQRGPSVS